MENLDHILDAPVIEEKAIHYAGFWRRFLALFIDYILLTMVNMPLAVFITNAAGQTKLSVIWLFSSLVYFSVMESSGRQGTIGKGIVGIKVGDVNGDQIGFGRAILRHFAKILSYLILLIGFIMAAFDEKKQALHDKIVRTYVFNR